MSMRNWTSIFACRVLEIYLNEDGDTAEIPPVVEGDRRPQAPKSTLRIDLGWVIDMFVFVPPTSESINLAASETMTDTWLNARAKKTWS